MQFQLRYDEVIEPAHQWLLWGAAYLIRGGCSDDSFDYFKGWLVAQGRTTFEAAVADPDSLVAVANLGDHPSKDYESEELMSAASTAHEAATGDDELYWEALAMAQAAADVKEYTGPAGEDFDFDDPADMGIRLPRLFARFPYEDGD